MTKIVFLCNLFWPLFYFRVKAKSISTIALLRMLALVPGILIGKLRGVPKMWRNFTSLLAVVDNLDIVSIIHHQSTVAHWYAICFVPGGQGSNPGKGEII